MIKLYIKIQFKLPGYKKKRSKIITYLLFAIIDFAMELDLNRLIHNAIYDLTRNKIYSSLVYLISMICF